MSRIGMMIGQYKIVREIGKGGMGIVYEAEHVMLSQRAAIKMLVGVTDDPEFSKRFKIEACVACAASHPGLVKVFDYGCAPDSTPFLMMEYLEGETLRTALSREGCFSPVRARRIGRQITAALAAIHSQGIVHRDLKPENVMLVPDDAAEGNERIKLLDFGIARRASETRTQPGTIVGTPVYMSPEQCMCGDIGFAADVYAAGIVLYEMLVGAPPFTGAPTCVITRHLFDDVPTAALDGAAPELRDTVLAMLAKEPRRRPTARLVADDLGSSSIPRAQALAATAPVPSRLTSVIAVRRRTVVVPSVAVMMTGALLGVIHMCQTPRRAPVVLSGMVALPGGAFTMGRTREEIDEECRRQGARCRHDAIEREQPARRVWLSPFFLDAHEATNAEFAAWLNTDPNQLRVEDDGPERPKAHVKDGRGVLLLDLDPDYLGVELVESPTRRFQVRVGFERKPVMQVSWDGARQYCEARGKRLPTEAEWEYAARRNTSQRYPWGDGEPRCDDVILGRTDKLACAALPPGPADVGSAAQDITSDGISDLGGNVSEWVQDAFTSPYYPSCGTCIDPVVDVLPPGAEDIRMFRGGSWGSIILARASARGRWKRGGVPYTIGFRCAARSS